MKSLAIFIVSALAARPVFQSVLENGESPFSQTLRNPLHLGLSEPPPYRSIEGHLTGPGPPCSNNESLPIVELPYERHRACKYNATTKTYHFTNIRFGQDTSGQNRWKKPLVPEIPSGELPTTDGGIDRQCPGTWNGCSHPSVTEDCLFLDVIVPESVWTRTAAVGAPIFFAIFGGGFRGAQKTDPDSDELMMHASREQSLDEFIWVTANYRVANLGWLGADEIVNNGVPNAGLHDIESALQWVEKYIHLFGGSSDNVTVYGWSSGAGIIAHLLTAYGGGETPQVPFRRAMMHSPGWTPTPDNTTRQNHYERFMKETGTENLEELRGKPFQDICAANGNPNNLIGIGPVVAGEFVPDSPATLFTEGKVKRNVEVMTGHGVMEGLQMAMDLMKRMGNRFDEWLTETFPVASDDVKNHIAQELYPYENISALPPQEMERRTKQAEDFTRTLQDLAGNLVPSLDTCQRWTGGCAQYWADLDRYSYAIAEGVFTCNTDFIQRAYNGYAWTFEQPGLHSQDFYYVLYNRALRPEAVFSDYYATIMKDYVLTFAQTGRPNSTRAENAFVPAFENTGMSPNRKAQVFGVSGLTIAHLRDDTDSDHCRWWQRVEYAGPEPSSIAEQISASKQHNSNDL